MHVVCAPVSFIISLPLFSVFGLNDLFWLGCVCKGEPFGIAAAGILEVQLSFMLPDEQHQSTEGLVVIY